VRWALYDAGSMSLARFVRQCVPLAMLLLAACESGDTELPYLDGTVTLSDEPQYRDVCRHETTVLRPAEAEKIERMLLGAPVPRKPMTHGEVVDITSALKVPAFGLATGGTDLPDGSLLLLYQFEVPCRAKERALLFHGRGESFRLIDDLVYSTSDERTVIRNVTLRGDRIDYDMGESGQHLVRPAF